MDDDEKYAFDLAGYITLRGLLTPAEVAAMNDAVDAMLRQSGDPAELQEETPGVSMANSSPLMRGSANVVNRLAAAIGTPDAAAALESALAGPIAQATAQNRGTVLVAELQQALEQLQLDGGRTLTAVEFRELMASAGEPEAETGLLKLEGTRYEFGGQLQWP